MDIKNIPDAYSHILNISKNMYKTGSDSRSTKGGNPEGLCNSVLSSNDIQCIGLWTNLPTNFKALIDDKELYKSMSPEDIKLVLKYILKYANKYSTNYYCYIKKNIIDDINDIINGHQNKNEKFVTNLRRYFIDTERKKCGGGGTKKGSNYSYNSIDHTNQQQFLKELL